MTALTLSQPTRRSVFSLNRPVDWALVTAGLFALPVSINGVRAQYPDGVAWPQGFVAASIDFIVGGGAVAGFAFLLLWMVRAAVRALLGQHWKAGVIPPLVEETAGQRHVRVMGGTVVFARDDDGAVKATVRGISKARHRAAVEASQSLLVAWQRETGAQPWI